jgi:Na+-transporting methylmalonyl-CoA/oxaloacetate decarboxylase gamma subunit
MIENLAWGLQLTVVGMGLVFGLLALLWGLIALVVRLDRPPKASSARKMMIDAAERVDTAVLITPSEHGLDADLVAAILVATLKHKAILRREAAPVMRAFRPGSLLHASRWVSSGRMHQNRVWRREGK